MVSAALAMIENESDSCKGIFISENNGECFAAWIMDGYVFTISGNIDKNEAIKLAHSTKIIDSP